MAALSGNLRCSGKHSVVGSGGCFGVRGVGSVGSVCVGVIFVGY